MERDATLKDPDVLAVKALIETTQDYSEPLANSGAAVQTSPLRRTAAGDTPKTTAHSKSIASFFAERIKSYEPNRRVILGTSFVLLVILRPWLVLGWSLAAAFALLLCYLLAGPDRFWRRVIALHAAYARRRPARARRLKLKACWYARKWDRFIQRLPQGLADTMASPDLRGLMQADERHDAVIAARLKRMDCDPSIQ